MVYGYARISRKQQSIERQIRNIKDYDKNAVIFQEAYTGTKINRPEWNKLYKKVKSGDTLIFDSVSRMSRNADEGYKIYEELFSKGVNLVFLKEPLINSSVYSDAKQKQIDIRLSTGKKSIDKFSNTLIGAVNELVLDLAKEQIRLAFEQAQKEVDDLHQRTKEGIETARINGKQIGLKQGTKLTTKKSVESKKLIEQHSKDFSGTLDDITVMKITGLSRNTYYKYKKELKASAQ